MAILITQARRACALIREHRRAFAALNAAYFLLILVGMGFSAMFPAIQDEMLGSARNSVESGPLAIVGDVYANGNAFQAAALTFVVNLFVGSVAFVTLPTMIVPFAGIATGAYRAVLWGLLFYPGHPRMGTMILPHLVTLVLEGEGYVVAMLAAWIHGRAWLWPASVGAEGRSRSYVEGLKRTAALYILVAAILLVAAVYESIEVIWFVKAKP
jgi:hypothetical protein